MIGVKSLVWHSLASKKHPTLVFPGKMVLMGFNVVPMFKGYLEGLGMRNHTDKSLRKSLDLQNHPRFLF